LSSRRRTSRPQPDRRISRFSPALARTFRPGQARYVQQFPGRQGRRHCHAPVYARGLPVARSRDRLGYGQCACCSTARFHTYRAWPQWSRSTASWAGEGSIRYRDMRTHYPLPPTFPGR
jgi:hypothetical protein